VYNQVQVPALGRVHDKEIDPSAFGTAVMFVGAAGGGM
jgi:hypothetical protein